MKNNFATATVIGLVLAALGIISPIIWDLYKGKTELTLTCEDFYPIVERKENVKELHVLYENKPVESVTRASFTIKNTGRKSLEKEDIKTPIKISFNGKILKYNIVKMFPEKGEYDVSIINENTVVTSFNLMNSGDYISIALLLDSSKTDFDATTRIVGVEKLKIVNDAKEDKKWNFSRRLGITGYIVLLASSISLFVVIFLAYPEVFYESALKSKLSSAIILLKSNTSVKEIKSYLSFLFFTKTRKQLTEINKILNEYKDDDILVEDSVNRIRQIVTSLANESSGAKEAGAFFTVLAIIGFSYVVWKFVMS